MANLNKVMLIARLTRDPALKYLPSETPVCEFGVATSRKFKTAAGEDREETAFVDCTAFGKQAEVINEHCQKGKELYLEGRLTFSSWEDKQTGGKRSKLTVTVENFQFIGPRSEQGDAPFGEDHRPQERRPAAGETRQTQPSRTLRGGRPPADASGYQRGDEGLPDNSSSDPQHFGGKKFKEADIPF